MTSYPVAHAGHSARLFAGALPTAGFRDGAIGARRECGTAMPRLDRSQRITPVALKRLRYPRLRGNTQRTIVSIDK